MRVLIADADTPRAERVETVVRLQWPDAECARVTDGWQLVERALRSDVDLILVDPGLVYAERRQLVRDVRRVSSVAMVLLLHRAGEADRLEFGKLGATDYVLSPFSPVELLTRARAALHLVEVSERGDGVAERRLRWSDGYLSIDFARARVWVSRAPVTLAPAEFRLLAELVLNAGRTISERSLLRLVLDEDDANATESLRVFLRRLSEQIEEDPDHPRYLVEDRGVGYRFVRATPLGRTRWYVLPAAEPVAEDTSEEVARVLNFARKAERKLKLVAAAGQTRDAVLPSAGPIAPLIPLPTRSALALVH